VCVKRMREREIERKRDECSGQSTGSSCPGQ
jgi:hypothetical protein